MIEAVQILMCMHYDIVVPCAILIARLGTTTKVLYVGLGIEIGIGIICDHGNIYHNPSPR
jgi:hypothetical protein